MSSNQKMNYLWPHEWKPLVNVEESSFLDDIMLHRLRSNYKTNIKVHQRDNCLNKWVLIASQRSSSRDLLADPHGITRLSACAWSPIWDQIYRENPVPLFHILPQITDEHVRHITPQSLDEKPVSTIFKSSTLISVSIKQTAGE